MDIFASLKAKNWIEGRIHSAIKDNKISILIFLIIISGFFFYNGFSSLFPNFFTNGYSSKENILIERAWIAGIFEAKPDHNEKVEKGKSFLIKNSILSSDEKEESANESVAEMQLQKMVGNAPIGEMIPSITKLDRKVAAFVVGIAKKESDWGKHSPSLAGTTCYNYWGYKGAGSRGTSMGYACFGSAEEAVDIVGKRIEKLVSKNINEPRQMLVWKCGSSCASHDPAGVQKWVSDVSLYFGKVMQI